VSSAYRCPENSHYEFCGSACPLTCGLSAHLNCTLPCAETCTCFGQRCIGGVINQSVVEDNRLKGWCTVLFIFFLCMIVFMGCNITCIHGFSFLKILFFTNFTFIVSRFLLCHLNNWLTESMKPLSQKQAVGSDWLVWAGVLRLAKL